MSKGETAMKTKEELNALTEEVETLNKKLAELTEEELEQVAGGVERLAVSCEHVYEPDVADLIFHLIE